jgi:hypothetical protein
MLWATEFHVHAKHGKEQIEWEPQVLRHPQNPLSRFPKDPESPIWWTTEEGQILADGIAIDVYDDQGGQHAVKALLSTGIIVNLTGEYKPRLTIDRRKALSWNKKWVLDSAVTSVSCLSELRDISYAWLWSLLIVLPQCEELINRELKLKNRIIPMKGQVEGGTFSLKALPDRAEKYSLEATRRPLSRRILNKMGIGSHTSLGINLGRRGSGDINPADIGLSRIRVSDIGVLRKDAFLWKLVYEAWAWELLRNKYKELDYPPIPIASCT